jgi:hypothetical protein
MPEIIPPRIKWSVCKAVKPITDLIGKTGDEASLAFCNKGAEDLNSDGLPDQVCNFYSRETGFQTGDIEGILKGRTVDGISIEGRDLVKIVR